MTSIVPRAFAIYRAAGFEPITGFSPYHFFNWRDAPFTLLLKGNQLVGCPGLALQEVMFLEHFRSYVAPKRILVIGNAHGWSTVVLALTFPDAKTVAIDIDPAGVQFTNELIAKNLLPARAITARSPDDVAAVVHEHLGGAVDFFLIDAIHTNAALLADFAATHAAAAPDALWLLHDVVNWHMIDGVTQILSRYGLKGKVLTRTASGMALIYSALASEFEAYLDCFADPPERFQALRQTCILNRADLIAPFARGYRPPAHGGGAAAVGQPAPAVQGEFP
jgi:hypothetical protein